VARASVGFQESNSNSLLLKMQDSGVPQAAAFSPFVNGASLPRYVGRQVRLVGSLKEIGATSVQLLSSDDQTITVRLRACSTR
jgi:Replication factor A protein 3